MPPPWLAYPEYERYSLGWRMGSGEDYLDRFVSWFEALGEKEREIYRALPGALYLGRLVGR